MLVRFGGTQGQAQGIEGVVLANINSYNGNSYEVSRITFSSWGSTLTCNCHSRNVRTGEWNVIPFQVRDGPPPSAFRPEIEEDEYFQIVELQEVDDGGKKTAILKSWSEPERIKKFKLESQYEEDKETIRAGLEVEDQEVFCTLAKVMGKEVIGKIRCLPKDPPILKMPDLVMDKLMTFMSYKERLSCRLVCRPWAYQVLPVKKFVKCSNLVVSQIPKTKDFQISANLSYLCVRTTPKQNMNLKFSPDFMDNAILSQVTCLTLCTTLAEKCHLERILNHCGNTQRLMVHINPEDVADTLDRRGRVLVRGGPIDDGESKKVFWKYLGKIIQRNEEHLETATISTRDFCGEEESGEFTNVIDIRSFFGGCISLKSLRLDLKFEVHLRNLESLPVSLTHLTLSKLPVPLTNTEVKWIGTNLVNLVKLVLYVQHHHGDVVEEEGDELKQETVSNMLISLPTLERLFLWLGTGPSDEGRKGLPLDKYCEKAKHMVKSVLDRAGGWRDCHIVPVEKEKKSEGFDSPKNSEFLEVVRNRKRCG